MQSFFILHCCLFVTASISSCAAFTTVVIIRSPTRIVIAADSKAEQWKTGKAREAPPTACKIRQSGGVAFASTGLVLDPQFNADKLTGRYLSQSGSLEDRVKRLTSETTKQFLEVARRFQRAMPEQYKEAVAESKTQGMLTIVFAGINRGITQIAVVVFRVTNGSLGNPVEVVPSLTFCPGILCPASAPTQSSVYGQNAAAYNAIHAGGFWTTDNVADARRIIDIEIRDQPATVGPPVDVLVIDDTSMHWISPYGSCSQEETSAKTKGRK